MKPLNQLLLIAGLSALAAGCASTPSRFYTLNATVTEGAAPAENLAVMVGPVFIPAAVDRPQFTVQTATNRVEIDEFNRWAAPLGDGIARVVTTDLGVLLGNPRVVTAPMPDFGPAYHVTIRVERFESIRGDATQSGEALIDATWVIRSPAGGIAGSGRTLAREPVQGNNFDALAAAHSRALAKVSADIAVVIRAAAAQKP
jgi:uncharacterized protein